MGTADTTGRGGNHDRDDPLSLDDASLDDALPSEGDARADEDDGDWREDMPLETEQLAFANEDVRLPWLETDDEEDDFQGSNTGQLMVLLAIGLLAIAVIGGGIWWVMSDRQDEVLIADGGVIAAPKQPYKEEPKDPGGKTFAGTGDTSFAVSEGQTRPARLDEKAEPKAAAPSPTPSAKPSAAATPAPSGVGVQVAAYSSRASAEAGWTRLSSQYEALSGLNHRVVEGSADIGTVYRLQVLAGIRQARMPCAAA